MFAEGMNSGRQRGEMMDGLHGKQGYRGKNIIVIEQAKSKVVGYNKGTMTTNGITGGTI